MNEQILAQIEIWDDTRLVVVFGVDNERGITTIRVERKERRSSDWRVVSRGIEIPCHALWLTRDALDKACALAARCRK